jgi:hypothetical protein
MPCAMLRPWFRGGCHACFCRPDGWVPSVLVLCKHEVSPWLPKRTARSAPPSFSPPSRKLPPAAAQKFQTAYHLMFDCEQLQTPLLATTTALIERRSCGMVWVAWTEFGSVGVGRRTSVRQIDRKPHTPGHPGLDPVSGTSGARGNTGVWPGGVTGSGFEKRVVHRERPNTVKRKI